jgi:hypothetical protein
MSSSTHLKHRGDSPPPPPQDKISEMAALMTAQKWTVDDARQNDIVMIDSNLTMLENGIELAQSKEEEESRKFAKEIAEEVGPSPLGPPLGPHPLGP